MTIGMDVSPVRSEAKPGFRLRVTGVLERGFLAPFLLAAQPVLQLFAINIAELDVSDILRSLLAAVLLAGASLGLGYLVLRDGRKASLAASLFLFLFFLFGDMAAWTSTTLSLGPARTDLLLLLLVAVLMLAWIGFLYRRIRNTGSANLYFNLLALVLFLGAGLQALRTMTAQGQTLFPARSARAAVDASGESGPDIYYIVLDGYGRQDILDALYELDNSDFLNELTARGFYVAGESSSNYIQTMLSLSSSLNMEYLQALQAGGTRIETRADLIDLVENSRVREILAQHGYRLISFHNEYKATIPGADVYYDDPRQGAARPVTAFESILIDRSMARVLTHVPAFKRLLIEMPYETHRRHILAAFTGLQDVPAREGKYFVYAHIIAPHPPFVFTEEGDVVPHDEPFTLHDANYYLRDHSRKSYITGYRRQTRYINSLVLETVDAILARSAAPPVIILQGDHGPGAYLHWGSLESTLPAERFGILNAYYFPDADSSLLYPSISPVNSFRVLFNTLFESGYPLLPDRHYYSSWSFPFDFVEVTDLSLPQ